MSDHSTYVIYGVRIDDDSDWLALDEDPGQCSNDGKVGYFSAGAYDNDMYFLAVSWEELEPGKYKVVSPFDEGDAPCYPQWNKLLVATVDRLGLKDLDEPGWYLIHDES
jgi:hypothetical protein